MHISDFKTSGWLADDVFYDRMAIKLLAVPERWKFISPFHPLPDNPAAGGRDFRKWMGRHWHTHPFYEVLLAVGGTAWHGIGHSIFHCWPGTMAITAPGQPHANRYRPADDNLRHIWVSFITVEQAFLQFVIVRHGKVRWVHDERSLINVGGLSRLLHVLRGLAEGNNPTKSLQVHLLLTAFFAELTHLIIEAGYRPVGLIERETLVHKKITMICEHIRKHGGANTTLTDLALLAGYTPGHFSRIFKQVTGHTVHQHIDTCRMDKAKEMLKRGLPIKAMAAELGFADKTTLSRWLNKYRRAVAP